MPSPVTIRPFVVGRKAWPAPPEARITFLARKTSRLPWRMSRATQPDARALVVGEQRGDEPLLEAVHGLVVLHELLVEHVEDRLAGDVGHVGGALHRGAAEGAQVELAGLVAVEGHPDVLEVDDLLRRLAAHDLDRVLVAEEVRALDRVEGVRLPRVLGVDRAVDAAGRRHRVRADRVDLGDDPHGRPGVGGGRRRALAGEARPDDQDVVCRHELDPFSIGIASCRSSSLATSAELPGAGRRGGAGALVDPVDVERRQVVRRLDLEGLVRREVDVPLPVVQLGRQQAHALVELAADLGRGPGRPSRRRLCLKT